MTCKYREKGGTRMRLLEWILVAFSLLLLLHLFSGRLLRWSGRAVSVLSGIVIMLQLFIEGYRWQLLFVYVVTGIMVIIVMRRVRQQTGGSQRVTIMNKVCYSLMGILILMSVVLSLVLPVFHLPLPDGAYKVGSQSFYFKDESRDEVFKHDNHDLHDKRELMYWTIGDT
jgi:membrane protein implicated in regulation of membrane protease activity